MIKGKSKIQLFDARTGKLEHEQTNTNIVTNAVQDLINDNDPLGLGKLTRMYSSSSGAYYCKAYDKRNFLSPLSTVAFGGVLLWDNTITEDPTITMPPDGVHEVGHAGDTYSGSNKYRGTYNSNESGALENGYRHVWDFGTDKANGEIKCLSLTSKSGGICGYQNDDKGNQESDPPYSYYQFNPDTTYQTLNNNYNYIGFDAFEGAGAGAYLYFAKNGDGTFYGIKRSTTDYTKIQQITFANPSIMTLSKIPNRIIEAKDLITGINQYAYTYVYDNKIHEIYRSGTSEITHKTYGLDGAALNTVTVNTPQPMNGNCSASSWNTAVFYYGGSYYYCVSTSPWTYRKCSATGDDEGEAFTLPKYGSDYYYYSALFLVDNYGTGILMLTNTQNGGSAAGEFRHIMHLYPNGDFCIFKNGRPGQANTYYADRYPALTPFKSPFVYVYGANTSNILLCADSRYLATINNLSEPVVKTSAQVMKVTYEITEGE